MATKYAGLPLYTIFSITSPIEFSDLNNIYGVTEYPTDSTTYTHLYSTSRDDNWLQEVSTQDVTILYDEDRGMFFISNRFNDSTLYSRWFNLTTLAQHTYTNSGVLDSGLSLSNDSITVYDIATWNAHDAVSFIDPTDNITKFLVKDISYDNFRWLTSSELENLGYSFSLPSVDTSFVLLNNSSGDVIYSIDAKEVYSIPTLINSIHGNMKHIGLPEVFFSGVPLQDAIDNKLYLDPNITDILPNETSTSYYSTGMTLNQSQYNSNYKYAVIDWYNTNDPAEIGGRSELQLTDFNGSIGIKNISENTISLSYVEFASCSDQLAEIIPVYSVSDGAVYNSFKVNFNNVEYYFVLDGVITDWVSDLRSIGYTSHNPDDPITMLFGLAWDTGSSNWETVNFNYASSDNYWYAGLLSEADKQILLDAGLTTTTLSYPRCGVIGTPEWTDAYSFEVIGVYSDINGNIDAGIDLSGFSCVKQNRSSKNIPMIWHDGYDTTSCKTWRCKISPKQIEYVDVILAAKYDTSSSQFISVTSNADDWWWSCVMNQEDKDKLIAFGLTVGDPKNSWGSTSYGYCGPYGCITYPSNSNFMYSILGVYSDIDGTVPISQDVSNFDIYYSSTWPRVVLIHNTLSTPTYMTWKCRIAKYV